MDYTIRPLGAARSTEVDLDDGTIRLLYLDETDWGEARQPDPEEQQSQNGSTLTHPLPTAWLRRELRIVGAVICRNHNDKRYQKSILDSLFQSRRTIRRHGWEMDVTFGTPRESGDSMRTSEAIVFEVVGYASPPFWRLADALASIQWSETLYADYGIPPQEAMPAYLFGRDLSGYSSITGDPGPTGIHFGITNWGTAYCNPVATITGGPVNTTLYLKGPGNYRPVITLDASGNGALLETMRFYLPPGFVGIRLENSDGSAINLTANSTMRIDFGATKLRFL